MTDLRHFYEEMDMNFYHTVESVHVIRIACIVTLRLSPNFLVRSLAKWWYFLIPWRVEPLQEVLKMFQLATELKSLKVAI